MKSSVEARTCRQAKETPPHPHHAFCSLPFRHGRGGSLAGRETSVSTHSTVLTQHSRPSYTHDTDYLHTLGLNFPGCLLLIGSHVYNHRSSCIPTCTIPSLWPLLLARTRAGNREIPRGHDERGIEGEAAAASAVLAAGPGRRQRLLQLLLRGCCPSSAREDGKVPSFLFLSLAGRRCRRGEGLAL